jgi:hypothetical protein
MAFFSLKQIHGDLYFAKNNQDKGFIFNLKNKKQLFEELYDGISNTPVKNYLVVRKDDKYALFHLKRGVISSWFYYIFLYNNGINAKLFKMGYLVASDDPKPSRYAIFKFDGTRISDYYNYIIVLEVKKNDILYSTTKEYEKKALFSLKSGRLTDWFEDFPHIEKCFIKGKGNYFIASKEDKHFLLRKKDYKAILEGMEIEPVFSDFGKDNEVYLVKVNKNEEFLFYQGYCTECYNSIFAVSENLFFIAIRKTKNKKEFYLIGLKNKTQRKISQFLFKKDEIYVKVSTNTPLYSSNMKSKLYSPYLYSVVTSEIGYCSNCNNIWFLYFEYKNNKICPLCEANKLEIFLI